MAELSVGASAVVDALDEALVVVSGGGEILECNDAFRSILADRDSYTGPVEDVLDGVPTLERHFGRREEGIVPVEERDSTVYFQLSIFGIDADTGADLSLIVLHDVTDQQRRQRELKRENKQLDRFASFISHDLRNPLDVAIGRTTVIDELVDDPQVSEHLSEIRASHRRMSRIIQDVLTLAREGQSIDDKQATDLSNVAASAWSHVETDGADIDIRADQSILADAERLGQVFENLFRNAVEHGSTTPDSQTHRNSVEHGSTGSRTQSDDAVEHGSTTPDSQAHRNSVEHWEESAAQSVTIVVGVLDDDAGFYVADDGTGIGADLRGNVLEAGFSGDDGTGLGLAIVSNIAGAHGWDVTVTESERGGARFDFTGVDVLAGG
jgi:signal transduction histidine kinase